MNPESIGKRIARLRQQHGWTQETLAGRIAISRVAVSHIEMDLSIPGERTIVLLAGLFKMPPHALVAGTTYPRAKADRLPPTICCHTNLELELALLQNDLTWLEQLVHTQEWPQLATAVWQKWLPRLHRWAQETAAAGEQESIAAARRALAEHCRAQEHAQKQENNFQTALPSRKQACSS